MNRGLLDGKVAVVTGSTNGLGRAIALRFAQHGAAAVIVADLSANPRTDELPTHEVIRRETSTQAEFVRCDVSVSAEVDGAIMMAESFGELDIVANIAGIAPPGTPMAEMSDEMIDEVIDVNLKGTMYGCRAAARVMVPRGRGSIINMSSIAGYRGSPGNPGYGASKGGIRLLTYALASQLGPFGIRVNVLHPGVIDTAMARAAGLTGVEPALLAKVPSRRIGAPTEVAGAAVFLASELASYVNGASLPVDGGMSTAM